MKPYHSVYFFSFLASILLHVTLFEGTSTLFHTQPSIQPLPEPHRQPLRLKFTESLKNSVAEPEQPTDLISDESNKAAQLADTADKTQPPDQPAIANDTTAESLKTVESIGNNASIPQPPTPPVQEPTPIDTPIQPEQKKEASSPVEPVNATVGEVTIHQQEQKKEETPENDTETSEPPVEETLLQKEPLPVQQQVTVPSQSSPSPPGQSPDGILDELIHDYTGDKDAFAEIRDQIQFNIKQHSMGEYIAAIKKKISPQWKMRLTKFYQAEMFSSGAVVVFKIDQDGNVVYSKVLEQFGNQFFGADCVEAIHQSAKFEPLPEEYLQKSGKKELWMMTTFGYDIR